nr:phospholipase-like protein [Tanacetum cinerariifolium]
MRVEGLATWDEGKITWGGRARVYGTVPEYPAKIHVRIKLHYFPLIKDRLNEARRSLFRTTCFRPWLDISYVENDDGMIHYVLQKQSFADDESFDLSLIYHLNGHSLHFGRPFIEDEEKLLKVSDEDAIRLCLLLSLETRVPEIIPEHCHGLEQLNVLSESISPSFFTSPKNEDISHSTSEDEPNNIDDISPKEEAGDVYCCDVNGDVS